MTKDFFFVEEKSYNYPVDNDVDTNYTKITTSLDLF